MRFTFDPTKDAINHAKHGSSPTDVALVFDAPGKLTLESQRMGEERLMDIAMVECAGVLVYVLREPDEVRAISLRRASRNERVLYDRWKEAD